MQIIVTVKVEVAEPGREDYPHTYLSRELSGAVTDNKAFMVSAAAQGVSLASAEVLSALEGVCGKQVPAEVLSALEGVCGKQVPDRAIVDWKH